MHFCPFFSALLLLSAIIHTPAEVNSDTYPPCILPSKSFASDLDTKSLCTGQQVTRKLAKSEAWRFAPVIYFHPLEQYLPTSVDEYLEAASIYDADQTRIGPATTENIQQLSADPNSKTYFLSARETTGYTYSGSPFLDGVSEAPLYYRINPGNGTWVYSYFMFIPWNGCSNQQVLTSDLSLDKQHVLDYVACEIGVHEGDWESLTVEVCGDLSSVVRVSYSQHAWNTQRDCTIGECMFLPNTHHPVAYAGLNSHALYPEPALAHIYYQTSLSVIANLEAVSFVDRAIPDPARSFRPSALNVISMGDDPPPEDIFPFENPADQAPTPISSKNNTTANDIEDNANNELENENMNADVKRLLLNIPPYLLSDPAVAAADASSDKDPTTRTQKQWNSGSYRKRREFLQAEDQGAAGNDDMEGQGEQQVGDGTGVPVPGSEDYEPSPFWVQFRGKWGASYLTKPRKIHEPLCISFNQSAYTECQDDRILELAREVLDLSTRKVVRELASNVYKTTTSLLTVAGPRGPAFHNAYLGWEEAEHAPILSSATAVATASCVNLTLLTFDNMESVARASHATDGKYSAGMAVGFVAVIAVVLSLVTLIARKVSYRNINYSLPSSLHSYQCTGWFSFLSVQSTSSLMLKTDWLGWKAIVLEALGDLPIPTITGIAMAVTGSLILWQGLDQAFDIVKRYTPDKYYYLEPVEHFFVVMAPVAIVCDSLTLINSFFVSERIVVYVTMRRLIGRDCRPLIATPIWFIWLSQALIFAGLLCAMFVAVVGFGFGSVAFSLYIALNSACDRTRDALEGVCIDLNDIIGHSFGSVFCGSTLQRFCNRWRSFDPYLILFGSLLLLTGQVFLFTALGGNYTQLRAPIPQGGSNEYEHDDLLTRNSSSRQTPRKTKSMNSILGMGTPLSRTPGLELQDDIPVAEIELMPLTMWSHED